MNYNGQPQYPPYHQPGRAPVYPQQFHQYGAPQYQHPLPQQPQPPPRIEVVIPTRNPQPHYQSSPHQDYYQRPPPPQYYAPPPQPTYNYDRQFVPLPSPPSFPLGQQPQVNGYTTMQHPRSSPDPLQNGYHQPPQPRQSAQQPPRQPSPEAEPDYAVLLLSLADEYFTAAKKLKSRSEDYYELIATGLGCLESVLINFNVEPLREAQISLQYAQVLFDETENYDDAERVLTKAIDICERNKFLDLKYSLQLLLSCVLFQSKAKAAIKDLQTLIEEVEAYKHTAWEYALRYQLVTFHLSNPTLRDIQQAIQQLERLGQSARRNGDKAVITFGAIVEAMLHLQTSHQDAVTSSQRALTTARAVLMDASAASVPQLAFLVELIDLCCSTRESNFEQGDQKRKRMHELFGAAIKNKPWQDNGSLLSIPISQTSLRGLLLQKGGLVQEAKGKHFLLFSWLDLEEVEVVGFLLSAASKTRKNASDRDKVQQFIDEGLNQTRELVRIGNEKTSPEYAERASRAKLLECRYLVEQSFLFCSSGNWKAARKTTRSLTNALDNMGYGPPRSMSCLAQYLSGVVEQAEGNLDAAFTIYQSPSLSLSKFQRPLTNGATSHGPISRSDSDFETSRNISILAAMNTLLIVNDPSHPAHSLRVSLIEQVNTLIKSCQDKNILASYTLIHQQVAERGVVVQKNQLVSALNAAKSIANIQITALVLMVMQQNFFRGVTDEHANKCVKAAAVNVKQWGDPTWSYVAAGIEAESFEFRGERQEVERMKQEMQRRLENMPEQVREKILARKG